MEIKFVPKGASETKSENGEVVKATLSGSITVKALDYSARMRLKAKFAKLQSPTDKLSEVIEERIIALADMAVELKPQIVSVELKDLETGREAKSIDDLYDDPAFDNCVSELVVAFAMGLRPN